MNDEAVYRTAPATPGLLKIYQVVELVGGGSVINGAYLVLFYILCLTMLLKALRISGITCLLRGGGCEFMATKTSRVAINQSFRLKRRRIKKR